jgi:hypothetical protein
VMFSQILDARSDLTDLRQAHRQLADEFTRCREALDRPGNASGLSAGRIDPTAAAQLDADARRAAASEFERVLEDIRALPGFQRFLAARRVTELLPAATDGPIVLLNIAALRCDALILTPDAVDVLPLPGVDPDTAVDQVDAFLNALNEVHDGVTSPAACAAAAQVLAAVLGWLGDHITSPVLDHLGYTAPPDGAPWPRVWWCPAGVLSLLPMHAAGHHHPSSTDAVIDRVISSTIPTLRALLHARAAPATDHEPHMLVVAMPHTPNQKNLPGAADEAATLNVLWAPRVRTLGLFNTDPATHATVTAQLPEHPLVHFSCHGYSDLNNPSTSRLLLADAPLTVTDLTHTQLSHAELAFLSACTTARTGAKLPDEPIHLAAACQLAGYRHVVATLWPTSDYITALLTEQFYVTLKTGTAGAAIALHQATRELRATNGDHPYLWAPYTHTGP